MSSTTTQNLSQPLDAVWGFNAAGVVLNWKANPANPNGTLYAVKRWITATGATTATWVAQQISATTWNDPASIAKQDCTYQIFAQDTAGTDSAQGWTVHGTWPGPATAASAVAVSAPAPAATPSAYQSDNWLATFPQDSTGFIDWQAYPLNGWRPIAFKASGQAPFASYDYNQLFV
jgi:hypothetical protein